MKICVLFGGHFDRYDEAVAMAIKASNKQQQRHTYTPPHTKSKRGKFKPK